jgi:SAM-dependent methyltransferase
MRATGKAALVAVGGLAAAALWWRRKSVGLSIRTAVLGRDAQPVHHSRAPEAPSRRGLANACSRSARGPATTRSTSPTGYSPAVGSRSSTCGTRCWTTPSSAQYSAASTNLTSTQGDARELPYADGTFDAAFLVAVLGEIPDQQQALGELARVIKPGGRHIVGELFGDPHWVSPGRLRERAERTGLGFDPPRRHPARLLRPLPTLSGDCQSEVGTTPEATTTAPVARRCSRRARRDLNHG